MKRALMIAVAVALATLVAGTALAQMGQRSPGPMGMSEQMATMMNMMTQMQEQMKGMPNMGAMQEQMGPMMGQMQGMMVQHQEMMKQLCPGATGAQAPKPGG